MWIRYRDKLGVIICVVDGVVSFLSGSIFFTTIDGDEMKINMNDVMEIGRCE